MLFTFKKNLLLFVFINLISVLLIIGQGCYTAPPPAEERPVEKKETVSKKDIHDLKKELEELYEKIAGEEKGKITKEDKSGYEKLFEDTVKEREMKKQMAQAYYQSALENFKAFNYARARDDCEKALTLDPDHAGAKDLMTRMAPLLGIKDEELKATKKFYEEELKVKLEQTAEEIQEHFNSGEKLFQQEEYTEAIKEFEKVIEKIRFTPYELSIGDLEQKTKDLLKRAKELEIIQNEELQRMYRETAKIQAELEEKKQQEEKRAVVMNMFKEAITLFENLQYEKAEKLCEDIIIKDPTFYKAYELKKDANWAKHKNYYIVFLDERFRYWRENRLEMEESLMPYHAFNDYIHPSRKEWLEKDERKVAMLGEVREEDPDVLAMKDRLQNTIIPKFDITDGGVEEIVEIIRVRTNLNIDFDSAIKAEVAGMKCTLKVTNLSAERILKIVLPQFGLTYMFEMGMIVIKKTEAAMARIMTEIFDVRDLTIRLTDMPGPDLTLRAEEGEEGVSLGTVFVQEERVRVQKEVLADLIKNNVAPGTWGEGGRDVNYLEGQRQLIVSHSPEVLEEVRQFLNNLRSFTGSMVSIETRFLFVSDEMLEDINAELRGLEGVELEDANEGLAQGVDNMEAGIWRGDRPTGGERFFDWRLRTRNVFIDRIAGDEQFPVADDLEDQGGLGLQYRVLGDETRMNLILRMLRKQQKARILVAPRVMVYNTQRAYVLVANQRSYIKDYDVVIATDAFAYDPIIDTFWDGLVLDVRPIISNDRKYITLELRPSLSQLIDIRLIDIRNRPIPPMSPRTIIQLPRLQIQSAGCTVRMPDRGTIIIGGLKRIIDRDKEAATPFLSKIPILGALFSKKIKGFEKNNIILIIYAKIIEPAELEKQIR